MPLGSYTAACKTGILTLFALISGVFLIAGCDTTSGSADLALTNGKIATVDSSFSYAEAVAIKGDRIVAVGTTEEIMEMVSAGTAVVDLEGRLAIPGFIEGHGHFMGLGSAKLNLDLSTAQNWGEIISMVAEAVEDAEPGEWITGRGWHQEKWDEVPDNTVEGVPTHHQLSDASPDNPVYLRHASGHAAFANQLALELGRISSETANPDGGEIVHDVRGEPTGLLRETAQRAVGRALAAYREQMSPEELRAESIEMIRLAGEEALQHGVTSFQDAGSGFATIDLLREQAAEGQLPIRLYVMVRGASAEELEENLDNYRMIGFGNEFLTVRSIKQAIDGALGSHGAWLLEPYEDMPSSVGLVVNPVEEIERDAEVAMNHGFQVNVHAIGDRANRETLDIYERVFEKTGNGETDHRWRIEHAQHIHPDDLKRFPDMGVIPAFQAVHCTSDAPWVYKRLGAERAESGAYMWRTLWDLGAVITNGTDVPVEKIDPFASYYATVSRRLSDGTQFFPEEVLTREEALQSYTINNAYAAFEEDVKGSIEPGKLADIAILSRDILTIPEDEILDTDVVQTILGGKIVYTRGGAED
ncbi:MAG: amidohydrolase [Rhodothermales bacterium]|nr:amidohydrolase [Rhodothermales bacterium]